MRRHRRRNKKQRRIIIISVCSLLLFMTIGYAAMSTNLEIKAKGNIVSNPTGGDALLEMVDIVTSGNGLYKDTYEEGRYIYKGANPNNYITFSGETWRIISVENDGTIKIMRAESIGDGIFDTSGTFGSNNWSRPADLNTYLNGEYLESLSDNDKVVTHNFSIGAVTYDNNDLAGQITSENGTTWSGEVGLITASEYLRANTNTAQCETNMLNNDNRTTCLRTNWMYSAVPDEAWMWAISPDASYSDTVVVVLGLSNHEGEVSGTYAIGINGVVPVLYLSSDITLSGTGTETDPFIITN